MGWDGIDKEGAVFYMKVVGATVVIKYMMYICNT